MTATGLNFYAENAGFDANLHRILYPSTLRITYPLQVAGNRLNAGAKRREKLRQRRLHSITNIIHYSD